MFKELTDKINYSQVELEILKFWKEQKIFEKSVSTREGKQGFTFYEGPPTANGRPGIHHVMSRTLKDLVCRYKTMCGFQVHRKAGWDTHGLPVEIEVEKMLGFKHKDDIVKYGIAKFNEECKKSVWKYKAEWEEMTERMGYWVDMSNPYITFENNYIESIWWALKQYFDKGMIYKGYKIQPYCPRCETPLSSHEVSLGYEDVKDPSIYVKMKVKGEENTYFLVWTTTPWTLISNVALAVHPDVDYVKVEHKGQNLILSEARLGVLDGKYEIIAKYKGKELVRKQYEPPFQTLANEHLLEQENYSYRVKRFLERPFGEFSTVELLLEKVDIIRGTTDELENFYVLTEYDGKMAFVPESLFVRMVSLPNYIRPIAGQIVRSLRDDIPNEIVSDNGITEWTIRGAQAFFVIDAGFVTTDDGSGVVHMAPAYGEDDYFASKEFDLPTVHPVNKSGEFLHGVAEFGGKFVKEADPLIIQNLKSRNLLYKKETITHSYPHCWRCKTPLLYYARDSWYIATTKYARRMVELNKTINWYPPEVGEGRFGNWLEENKDWSLSRDRFWGTPLPIWICEKCGRQECIGSVKELEEVSGFRFEVSGKEPKSQTSNLSERSSSDKPLDLHKPFVDEITWKCTCGGTMERTPELIDVWFDSGAMPFAQWHYPFENQEIFKSQHPADYICEGVDQTRGWFYSLHSISTFLFDKPAFRNLIVNELILDKEGQKMSKSKGNTVDPFEIIEKYGADTTRWYLVATSPPWRPTLFDKEGLVEVQRKFFSTLLNTYAFFSLYANIDGFSHSEQSVPVKKRPEIDRWILSALNSLVKRYRQAMDEYDVTRAARDVSEFTIDELSNWYVRRNRRRFWSKTPYGIVDRLVENNELVADKISAYQTLYECLIAITKLMAPFAPFISEEIYRNLNGVARKEQVESVHLTMLPELNEAMIDLELEERMSKAQRIVSLVRAIRNKSNIKVRQPLPRVIVPVANQRDRETVSRMENVILDEINVKRIEYVADDSEIVHKVAKPNFKVLGPKHGKSVQTVATAIRKFGPKEIKEVETNGQLSIPINGSTTTVMREDVEIIHEDIKGWMVESDNDLIVALDIELTEDLIDEGYAREFVNRVQNMRKDAGFSVTDRIRIYYEGSERLTKAIQSLKEYIQNETLAVKFDVTPPPDGYATEVDLNSETCVITIARHQSNGA